MTDDQAQTLIISILVLLALAIPLGLLLVSWLLHPNSREEGQDSKHEPYECGLTATVGSAESRFSIKFYLVAMLFLVFDLEVAFLYPLALRFTALDGWGIFWLLVVFLLILEVGYLYLYRSGALDWD